MDIIDNQEAKQYEMHVDGEIVRIEYIRALNKIYLTHTEVPRSLEGRGLGSQIVKSVLEDIDEKELILIPMCPFVAGYIKKHPEWKKLVLRGINIA
ncbi:MAG: GNAT family N-acetyltransferase [Maribacter sp.]|uniref:GNAT family N-acetyltransferase n=1 Tax=Maribacter sp. 2307UL18-2 TaxID=3386274 RepID=UPI0039BCC007